MTLAVRATETLHRMQALKYLHTPEYIPNDIKERGHYGRGTPHSSLRVSRASNKNEKKGKRREKIC